MNPFALAYREQQQLFLFDKTYLLGTLLKVGGLSTRAFHRPILLESDNSLGYHTGAVSVVLIFDLGVCQKNLKGLEDHPVMSYSLCFHLGVSK